MTRTPNKNSSRAKTQEANDENARMLLAMGTADRETFAAITGKGLSVYWRPSAWITGVDGRQPAYWNPIFSACVRLGIGCEFVRDSNGVATVTFSELSEEQAEAQRNEIREANKSYRAKLRARKKENKEAGAA